MVKHQVTEKINYFQSEKSKVFRIIFEEINKTLIHHDIINLDIIAIDGTKIKANASKSKSLKKNEISFLKKNTIIRRSTKINR